MNKERSLSVYDVVANENKTCLGLNSINYILIYISQCDETPDKAAICFPSVNPILYLFFKYRNISPLHNSFQCLHFSCWSQCSRRRVHRGFTVKKHYLYFLFKLDEIPRLYF